MNKKIDWNNVSITDLKDINAQKDRNGITALHYLAYYNSDEQIIDYALTKSGDINVQDDFGRTPLHFSLMGSNSLSIMKKILAGGGDINIHDQDGNQALHIAAIYIDNGQLIKEIINRGGDARKKNARGLTPLHLACVHNENISKNIIQELLKKFDNINEITNEGYTALLLALETRKSSEALIELIDCGADVNVVNTDGMSPLHLAVAQKNRLDVIDKLLAAGADILCNNNNDDTPLHYLAGRNSHPQALEIIDRFIKLNFPINRENADARTALHHACFFNNNHKIVEKLIAAGGDLNKWDKSGLSPCDYLRRRNPKIFKKIISTHGNKVPLEKFARLELPGMAVKPPETLN